MVLRKKALKIRKKSISLIRVISHMYSKNFLKIFPKLILTNTMRHSHQKNYSTALRKLTASAIGSVLLLGKRYSIIISNFYILKCKPKSCEKCFENYFFMGTLYNWFWADKFSSRFFT